VRPSVDIFGLRSDTLTMYQYDFLTQCFAFIIARERENSKLNPLKETLFCSGEDHSFECTFCFNHIIIINTPLFCCFETMES